MSWRSRIMGVQLYPDSIEFLDTTKRLEDNYNYVKILHDKDTDENGEMLKAHYHYVIKAENAIWSTAVATVIGISESLVYKIDNYKRGLAYLIHKNNSDKWQYTPEEVSGTLLEDFKSSIEDKAITEGAHITAILDYIDAQKYIYYKDFARICANMGWWAVYRRSGAIINGIIKEHNTNHYLADLKSDSVPSDVEKNI